MYTSIKTLTDALLSFTWSDEAHFIFGSSVFYPLVATFLLFLVAEAMPEPVVDQCVSFCCRKYRKVKEYINRQKWLLPSAKYLFEITRAAYSIK